MANKRSIILRGSPLVNEYGKATETIKPGYLVKGVSSVAKQTGTVKVPRSLAVERDELGQGIDDKRLSPGTNTAFYASGDVVKIAAFNGGDEAVCYVASGVNVVEDLLLGSAGNGLLAADTVNTIARAMETLGVVTVETAVRVQFI
jgi:hypothetical protein